MSVERVNGSAKVERTSHQDVFACLEACTPAAKWMEANVVEDGGVTKISFTDYVDVQGAAHQLRQQGYDIVGVSPSDPSGLDKKCSISFRPEPMADVSEIADQVVEGVEAASAN